MRLNKFIASGSPYSRRKADDLIKAGKVFLNGKIVTELGTIVDPEHDEVKINNRIITPAEEKMYIALNKPLGYLCTRNDDRNRKTIMELVPQGKNLKPVGRLDLDTEGLILLSNDGEFINRLTHPRFECPKEYYVEIEGNLSLDEKAVLEKGIILEGKKTAPAKIQILGDEASSIKIEIHEGRKRQIRKMFASLRHFVKYLQRIRIGKIHLGQLEKGQFRQLTKEEINAFKST